MRSVSKPLTNAEKLRRHHDGVASRLERIEVAVENLREEHPSVSWPSGSKCSRANKAHSQYEAVRV